MASQTKAVNRALFTYERRMTPENVLVLWRSNDQSYGKVIADYYQTARSIPADNMLEVTSTWEPSDSLITIPTIPKADMQAMIDQVADYIDTNALDITTVLLCGYWAHKVSGVAYSFYLDMAFSMPHVYKDLGLDISPTFVNIGAPSDYTDGERGLRLSAESYDDYPYDYASGYPLGNLFPRLWVGAPAYARNRTNRRSYMDDQRRITYGVMLMAAPLVENITDPNTNSLEIVYRMIDDAIAAETAEYSDMGNVYASGGSSSNKSGRFIYIDAKDIGYPLDNIYVAQMENNASESYFLADPLPNDIVDNYPAGASSLKVGVAGFVNQSDVFLRSVGNDAYHGSSTAVSEQAINYDYRQGAICGFGQSYGAKPALHTGASWFHTEMTTPDQTATDAFDSADAGMIANNTVLATLIPVLINRDTTGGIATATIEIVSNDLILREDGGVVATIAISGTCDEILTQILTALPANWTATVRNGGSESRCAAALRSGACIVFGALDEPYTGGDWNSYAFFKSLWYGFSIGELLMIMAIPGSRIASWDSAGGTPKAFIGIGDPLYRPFGHREDAYIASLT